MHFVPSLRWRHMLAPATLAVLTGCSERNTLPSVLSQAPAAATADLIGAPSDWDHLSADFAIAYRGGEFLAGVTLPPRRMNVRMERTLSTDGDWTTSVAYLSAPTRGTPRNPSATRIVGRGDGSVQLFDFAGTELHREASGLKDNSGSGNAANRPRRRQTDPREWLSELIVGPQSRSNVRAAHERAFGPAKDRGHGRAKYRKVTAAGTLESVIDEDRGVIVEQNTYDSGKRVIHVAHEWREVQPGVFQKSVTRIERAAKDASSRPLVIELVMSDLRLERKGGTQ